MATWLTLARTPMPSVTILYWRDIPAQVLVGRGRSAARGLLAERFEQAIDRCAMKVGAKDSDAYLAEWRRVPSGEVEGEAQDVAKAEVARLEDLYSQEKIKGLIDNDGWSAKD